MAAQLRQHAHSRVVPIRRRKVRHGLALGAIEVRSRTGQKTSFVQTFGAKTFGAKAFGAKGADKFIFQKLKAEEALKKSRFFVGNLSNTILNFSASHEIFEKW